MQDDSAAKVDRKPDSLLFSLKELRRIEDTRVSQEEESVRREAEQRRLQAEAEARRAEEEAERLRKERLERQRARQQQEEMAAREERLRLAEAERRARVEAEMALERERLKLEIAARPLPRQSPWSGITIGVGVLLAGAVALLGYELHKKAEEVAQANQRRGRYARLEATYTQTARELQRSQSQLEGKRRVIQALEQRISSLVRRAEQAEAATNARPRGRRRRRGKRPTKEDRTIRLCDPKDPMCGGLEDDGSGGKRSR